MPLGGSIENKNLQLAANKFYDNEKNLIEKLFYEEDFKAAGKDFKKMLHLLQKHGPNKTEEELKELEEKLV